MTQLFLQLLYDGAGPVGRQVSARHADHNKIRRAQRKPGAGAARPRFRPRAAVRLHGPLGYQ